MFGLDKSQKVVGVKQTIKALKSKDCETLYIAKDADVDVVNPVIELAVAKNVEIVYVDTMKQLGEQCHIDVGAAAALILKE